MCIDTSIEENTIQILYFLIFINGKSIDAYDSTKKFSFEVNDLDEIKAINIDFDETLVFLESRKILTYDVVTDDEETYLAYEGTFKIKIFSDFCFQLLSASKGNYEKLLEEKASILNYDPQKMDITISSANQKIKSIQQNIKENTELFNGIEPYIKELEKYLSSVKTINSNFTDVYKNIIAPITKESKNGVKATAKWAIISIIVSLIISLLIQNWTVISNLINYIIKKFLH